MIAHNSPKLNDFAELVAAWGSRMNLVSDPTPEAVMEQHVDDCVRAWECLKDDFGADKFEELPIVDIGSGAGFPGMVWAILNPKTKVFLVESREKRVTFLRHAALKLDLKNVEVICSRYEDLPREKLPSRCLFTSRAVGYDVGLIDLMLKDVASNRSVWVVMSGPESSERLKNSVQRITVEGGLANTTELKGLNYELPEGLGGRNLLVVSLR